MFAALKTFKRLPLHVRAGIVLRALCTLFAIPVTALANELWNYPHHDQIQSLIRFVGSAMAMILNLWFFVTYVAIMRGSKGPFIKFSLTFMFVGDLVVFGLLVAGFVLPFTRPIERYEDSIYVSNLAREWQLQQAAMKKEWWTQFLVMSPLLCVTQLIAMGFVYLTGLHAYRTLDGSVQNPAV